jgi:hypothetical protein
MTLTNFGSESSRTTAGFGRVVSMEAAMVLIKDLGFMSPHMNCWSVGYRKAKNCIINAGIGGAAILTTLKPLPGLNTGN